MASARLEPTTHGFLGKHANHSPAVHPSPLSKKQADLT